MPWTPEFLREIHGSGETIRPLFAIESLIPPEEIGRGKWRLVSRETLDGLPYIADGAGRFQGTSITPRTWSSSTGAWSVPLVGDLRLLRGRLWRGQLVQMLVGFPGWNIDQFEPVMLGQVWNLRGSPGRYQLEMRDIFSALQSRIDTTASEQALFYDLGAAATQTTLSVAYTVGDNHLHLTDSTKIKRQDDGTGALIGVVQVTPDAGSVFYLTYTGNAANQLTGVSVAGAFGSTAGDAAIGKAVVTVVYMDDHPIDAARRIITSTGARTNGDYDTLPASWGLGIKDRHLDHMDMSRWKPYSTPDAGSGDWDWLEVQAQDDALAWLSQRLALGGFFLAVRQGRITCRCAIEINEGSTDSLSTGAPLAQPAITDDDILSIDGWEAWHSSYGTESDHISVRTSGGSTASSGHVNGVPAIEDYEYDLSALIYSNEAQHRACIAKRLNHWSNRIPERLTVTCGGLSHARLCPGDIVAVTSRYVFTRRDIEGIGYANRRAMVTRVSPDWWHGSTQIELAVMGDRDNEYA